MRKGCRGRGHVVSRVQFKFDLPELQDLLPATTFVAAACSFLRPSLLHLHLSEEISVLFFLHISLLFSIRPFCSLSLGTCPWHSTPEYVPSSFLRPFTLIELRDVQFRPRTGPQRPKVGGDENAIVNKHVKHSSIGAPIRVTAKSGPQRPALGEVTANAVNKNVCIFYLHYTTVIVDGSCELVVDIWSL